MYLLKNGFKRGKHEILYISFQSKQGDKATMMQGVTGNDIA